MSFLEEIKKELNESKCQMEYTEDRFKEISDRIFAQLNMSNSEEIYATYEELKYLLDNQLIPAMELRIVCMQRFVNQLNINGDEALIKEWTEKMEELKHLRQDYNSLCIDIKMLINSHLKK